MKVIPSYGNFQKYKIHVVTPGELHNVMNYMGMVTGHKYRASGSAEIILEAGLIYLQLPEQ